jgi:hypothetical protein
MLLMCSEGLTFHTARLGSQAFNVLMPVSDKRCFPGPLSQRTDKLRMVHSSKRALVDALGQIFGVSPGTCLPSYSKLRTWGIRLQSTAGNDIPQNNETRFTGLEGLTAEEIEALPDLGSFVREGVETIEEIMAQDIR